MTDAGLRPRFSGITLSPCCPGIAASVAAPLSLRHALPSKKYACQGHYRGSPIREFIVGKKSALAEENAALPKSKQRPG
jgi:hypothetical protein